MKPNNSTALICERCGAPMLTRRECHYCGTLYYTGPDLSEQENVNSFRQGMYATSYSITWGSNSTPIGIGSHLAGEHRGY